MDAASRFVRGVLVGLGGLALLCTTAVTVIAQEGRLRRPGGLRAVPQARAGALYLSLAGSNSDVDFVNTVYEN